MWLLMQFIVRCTYVTNFCFEIKRFFIYNENALCLWTIIKILQNDELMTRKPESFATNVSCDL